MSVIPKKSKKSVVSFTYMYVYYSRYKTICILLIWTTIISLSFILYNNKITIIDIKTKTVFQHVLIDIYSWHVNRGEGINKY